jgi:hypothetical protein
MLINDIFKEREKVSRENEGNMVFRTKYAPPRKIQWNDVL